MKTSSDLIALLLRTKKESHMGKNSNSNSRRTRYANFSKEIDCYPSHTWRKATDFLSRNALKCCKDC